MNELVQLSDEVRAALADGGPVVALETTIVAHGFPQPDGVEVGLAMEQAVREAGAVPATIGVADGRIRVGLDGDELARFDSTARKLGPRDLAACAVSGAVGATTVGGVLAVAWLIGIRFMGTGGIGGVHRGYPHPPDVSADLFALASSPVVVTCSGAKSLLDIPATMEHLETLGIPVLGYRTDTLPLFYEADGGPPVSQRVEDSATAARIAAAHWELGGRGPSPREPAPREHRGRRSDRGGGRRSRAARRLRPARHAVRARLPPRSLERPHARSEPRARDRQRTAGRRGLGSVRRALSLYDAVRDLPLHVEGYALELLQLQARPDFLRKTTMVRLHGDGEEGIGEDVTYEASEHDRLQERGPDLPLAGDWTIDSFSTHLGGATALRPAARARGLRRLPPLGLRERGARPRAPAGGDFRSERRVGRETTTAGLRRVDGARVTAFDRARARLARPLPRRCGSSSTPTSDWTDELDRRARATRRCRLGRLQGALPRDDRRRRRPTPTSTAASSRRSRRPGSRIPTLDGRDDARPRAASRPGHLGRDHPLGRRHRGAPLAAEDREREAVALRLDRAALRGLRLLRGERDRRVRRRPVRARPRARAHPATSPRSSIRTRRTTSRPREFNLPSRRRACRRARSRSRRARPGSSASSYSRLLSRSSTGIRGSDSSFALPRAPSATETFAIVRSSGASTMFTKSYSPSAAHWWSDLRTHLLDVAVDLTKPLRVRVQRLDSLLGQRREHQVRRHLAPSSLLASVTERSWST